MLKHVSNKVVRFSQGVVIVAVFGFIVFGLVVSKTQAQSDALTTAKAQMLVACPAIYETFDTVLDPEKSDSVTWLDDADQADFLSYLSSIDGLAQLTDADRQRMALDFTVVLSECESARAQVMMLSGGVASGLNGLTLIAEQEDSVLSEENYTPMSYVGGDQNNPASSCLQIKQANNLVGSGVYWVKLTDDPDTPPMSVYCEMQHDGGGWTYLAYVDSHANSGALFEQAKVGYNNTRVRPSTSNTVYSLGAMANLGATEIIFTLDTPDIPHAKHLSKYVRYRFEQNHISFITGPIPCTAGDDFEYSINDQDYFPAKHNNCNTYRWYPSTLSNSYLAIIYNAGYGVYWGSAMGGNNTWYHDAWVYVR